MKALVARSLTVRLTSPLRGTTAVVRTVPSATNRYTDDIRFRVPADSSLVVREFLRPGDTVASYGTFCVTSSEGPCSFGGWSSTGAATSCGAAKWDGWRARTSHAQLDMVCASTGGADAVHTLFAIPFA
jgi:hypothetical protein